MSNIESLIGGTPLVRLCTLFPGTPKVYAKLEMFNPGGSMKDRAAFGMVKAALEEGAVIPGGTVIESSSGNMGIGLAQACRHFGLRFICVADERTNKQTIKIMRALGATVEVIRATPDKPDLLANRLERVRGLCGTIPGSYWTNQYSNVHAAKAYYPMMAEIVRALDGKIDYVFCATGTCGTIRGCADYIAARGMSTKVVAVDAVGSVIFGGPAGKRLIPGHGAAMRPGLYRPGMADDVVHMTDLDCIQGCRQLREHETLLAGGSSGAVVRAVQAHMPHIPPQSTVVLVLADRGDRYLETVYNDRWVSRMCKEKGFTYDSSTQ